MRHIISVLAIAALMAVLMVTTVSPAFAVGGGWGQIKEPGQKIGYGSDGANHRCQSGPPNAQGHAWGSCTDEL
jgi:hypothetical protein